MKVVDRFNVSKPPEGPRKFTFEFTGPGLISVVVVAVLGVVWVFILGVLVGRGYKPENAVPQVAQIMPTTAPPTQQDNQEPPKVLKPEELQFQDTLQGKKPQETVTVDSTKKPGDAQAPAAPQGGASSDAAVVPTDTLAKTPAPLPKGRVATSPAQPDKKAVPEDHAKSKDTAKTSSKDSKDSKDSKKSKDSGDKRYRETYQLAALDQKSQAESEVERLAKKGIKASAVEVNLKGKTVYRVLTHITGTETEIKQELEKTGVKKPILRGKKSL